jgi:hypothetical protein
VPVVVTLISGPTGHDANTSVADVEYRVAIVRGIGIFGASFACVLFATFTRIVAMPFAGEPLPRSLHWLRDLWHYSLACLHCASMIALFYAALGSLSEGRTLLASLRATTLPYEGAAFVPIAISSDRRTLLGPQTFKAGDSA